MATNKVINIDGNDQSADWIKLVNRGKSRKRELAIHDQLAKDYAAAPVAPGATTPIPDQPTGDSAAS